MTALPSAVAIISQIPFRHAGHLTCQIISCILPPALLGFLTVIQAERTLQASFNSGNFHKLHVYCKYAQPERNSLITASPKDGRLPLRLFPSYVPLFGLKAHPYDLPGAMPAFLSSTTFPGRHLLMSIDAPPRT